MKCWTNSPSETFTDYSHCKSECNLGSVHGAVHLLKRTAKKFWLKKKKSDRHCLIFVKFEYNLFVCVWQNAQGQQDWNMTNSAAPPQRLLYRERAALELCGRIFGGLCLFKSAPPWQHALGFMHKHELAFQLSPHITNLNLNEPPLQIHQQAMTLRPPPTALATAPPPCPTPYSLPPATHIHQQAIISRHPSAPPRPPQTPTRAAAAATLISTHTLAPPFFFFFFFAATPPAARCSFD